WLFLQVLPGRFMAATETPDNFPLLRDLVQSVFSFFPHTPALQIGLNRDIRFAIPSVDEWHQIGHTLAPKDVWKKHLSEPGMLSLTMHSPRSDKRAGHVQVSVKPMKTTRPYEVEVAYNSHVDLPPKSTMDSSLNDVTSEWDIALNAAEALAVDVISRAMRVPIQ
ncbi:MAG: hypothetical protein ACREV5_13825, partial [Steroidobacter sp.]